MADLWDLFKQIGSSASSAPLSHLIVGLGNPGKEYDCTRHNTGAMALDAFAATLGVRVDRLRFRALTGEATLGTHRVLLMKPQTYMNLSGESVREAAAFYHIPAGNVLVLCDDIQFPVGRMRLRRSGSAGGHNGLANIIAQLGSDAFPRIRIGVGQKPHPEQDLADWVLSRFQPEEKEALTALFPQVGEAVQLIVDGRMEEASCRFSK